MAKVALVCGHFVPQLGYLEVHLARAWSALGHEVSVFTSNQIPNYVKHLADQPLDAHADPRDKEYTIKR